MHPRVLRSWQRAKVLTPAAESSWRPAFVLKVVVAYCNGLTQQQIAAELDVLCRLAWLGARFGVYHRTVAAHLVRHSVPMRTRGLAEEDIPEAVRLYESGMNMIEVGLRFGVSQGVAKRTVAAAGTTIRPRGRRVMATA